MVKHCSYRPPELPEHPYCDGIAPTLRGWLGHFAELEGRAVERLFLEMTAPVAVGIIRSYDPKAPIAEILACYRREWWYAWLLVYLTYPPENWLINKCVNGNGVVHVKP